MISDSIQIIIDPVQASSELDEIMQLSDRIAVMYRGKIIDILDAEKTNKEEVGLLMAGENE